MDCEKYTPLTNREAYLTSDAEQRVKKRFLIIRSTKTSGSSIMNNVFRFKNLFADVKI